MKYAKSILFIYILLICFMAVPGYGDITTISSLPHTFDTNDKTNPWDGVGNDWDTIRFSGSLHTNTNGLTLTSADSMLRGVIVQFQDDTIFFGEDANDSRKGLLINGTSSLGTANIIIEGPGAIVHNIDIAGGDTVEAIRCIDYVFANNITIKNLSITCNGGHTTAGQSRAKGSFGIFTSGGSNVNENAMVHSNLVYACSIYHNGPTHWSRQYPAIIPVRIQGNLGNGDPFINDFDSTYNFRISNCVIVSNHTGIYFNSEDTFIGYVWIDSNTVTTDGIPDWDSGDNGNCYGIHIREAALGQIWDNTCIAGSTNTGGVGIFIDGVRPAGISSWTICHCNSNTIYSHLGGTSQGCSGIRIRGGVQYWKVHHNIITVEADTNSTTNYIGPYGYGIRYGDNAGDINDNYTWIYNNRINTKVVHGDSTTEMAALNIRTTNPDLEMDLRIYNNYLKSDHSPLWIGEGSGVCNNVLCSGDTLVKGDNPTPSYHTIRMGELTYAYHATNIEILDAVYNGTEHEDVLFGSNANLDISFQRSFNYNLIDSSDYPLAHSFWIIDGVPDTVYSGNAGEADTLQDTLTYYYRENNSGVPDTIDHNDFTIKTKYQTAPQIWDSTSYTYTATCSSIVDTTFVANFASEDVVFDYPDPIIAGGYKSIAVLVDSTDGALTAAEQSNYDSTEQLFRYLRWARPDVDTIYLSNGGVPYAADREAFIDSIRDYQLIINAQEKIAVLGDTSSNGQGLQGYMIRGIYEYIKDGGCFLNLDPHLAIAGHTLYRADSVKYSKQIWDLTVGAGANASAIITYGDNRLFKHLNKNFRDSLTVANAGYLFGYYPVTAIGAPNVDTLAMINTGTDRPYIIGTEYGIGGYCVQWLGGHRWLFPHYSDTVGYHAGFDPGWTYETHGPARDLDHLIYAPIDFMLARRGVSATLEVPKLVYGQIVHLGEYVNAYCGPYLSTGMPLTLRIYSGEIDAGESAKLIELSKSDMLGIQYHSHNSTTMQWLWHDADSTPAWRDWETAEWDSITEVLMEMEDSSSGIFNGCYVIKAFSPHTHPDANAPGLSWNVGVDSCVLDSFVSWDVRYMHTGPACLDSLREYRAGQPYRTKHCAADWLQCSDGSSAIFEGRLWVLRWRRSMDWSVSHIFGEGMYRAGVAGNADTCGYILDLMRDELSVMQGSKVGVTMRTRTNNISTLGVARWDTACFNMKALIDSAGCIKVPDIYPLMLTCYRDSVLLSNYTSNKNSIVFDLTEACMNEIPINMTYTVRKLRADNSIAEETVFLPTGWNGTIRCQSIYNEKTDSWSHSPGWKAQSGNITFKTIYPNKGGWLN